MRTSYKTVLDDFCAFVLENSQDYLITDEAISILEKYKIRTKKEIKQLREDFKEELAVYRT